MQLNHTFVSCPLAQLPNDLLVVRLICIQTTTTNAILCLLQRICYSTPVTRGAVVSAALSERKVAGSIPTIGDFHTVGPCKKAVFACLATDVK